MVLSALIGTALLGQSAQASSAKSTAPKAPPADFAEVVSSYQKNAFASDKEFVGKRIAGTVYVREVANSNQGPIIIGGLTFDSTAPVINMTLLSASRANAAKLERGDQIKFSGVLRRRVVLQERQERSAWLSDGLYVGSVLVNVPIYVLSNGSFTVVETQRQRSAKGRAEQEKRMQENRAQHGELAKIQEAASAFDIDALERMHRGIMIQGNLHSFSTEAIVTLCLEAAMRGSLAPEARKAFGWILTKTGKTGNEWMPSDSGRRMPLMPLVDVFNQLLKQMGGPISMSQFEASTELLRVFLDHYFRVEPGWPAGTFIKNVWTPRTQPDSYAVGQPLRGDRLVSYITFLMQDQRIKEMKNYNTEMLQPLQELAYPYNNITRMRHTTDPVLLRLQRVVPEPDPDPSSHNVSAVFASGTP